jgi:hypothetical protein
MVEAADSLHLAQLRASMGIAVKVRARQVALNITKHRLRVSAGVSPRQLPTALGNDAVDQRSWLGQPSSRCQQKGPCSPEC